MLQTWARPGRNRRKGYSHSFQMGNWNKMQFKVCHLNVCLVLLMKPATQRHLVILKKKSTKVLISYWNVQEIHAQEYIWKWSWLSFFILWSLTSFKIWPPSDMPKDAWNQVLNLYLCHLCVSALQFTTQIRSSSGLVLTNSNQQN